MSKTNEKMTELDEIAFRTTSTVSHLQENVTQTSEKVTEIESNLCRTTEDVIRMKEQLSTLFEVEESASSKVNQLDVVVRQTSEEVTKMKSQLSTLTEKESQDKEIHGYIKRELTETEASVIKNWLLKRNNRTTSRIPITPLQHRSLRKELSIEKLYVPVVIREDLSFVQSNREVTEPYDILTEDGGVTYLLGDAAYGKTTYCIWLLKQWCDSQQANEMGIQIEDKWKKAMKEFDFVFLLRLGNMNSKRACVIDMICDDIKRSGIEYEILRHLFGSEKYKSLILIDGLDEWNPNEEVKNQFDLNILPNMDHLYDNVSILITMRSWLFPTIKVESPDKVIEIHGLSENGIKEVVENVLVNFYNLKTEEEDYLKAHKQISKELQNKSLKSFMQIPLLVVVCVQIWYEKRMFGEGVSSLFAALINMLILRATEKYQIHIKPDEDADYKLPKLFSENENLKNSITLISRLGKLAYHQLLCNKTNMVFQNKTIEKEIGMDTNELQFLLDVGLLSKKEEPCALGKNIYINFFHRIVQEFLAAIFITQGNMVDFFCEHLSNVKDIMEFSNVIMFVCGISPRLAATVLRQVINVTDKDEQFNKYRLTASMQGDDTVIEIYKLQIIWYKEFKSGLEMTGTTEAFSVSDIYLSSNSDVDTVCATKEFLSCRNVGIRSLHLDNVPSSGELSISDMELNAFLGIKGGSGSLVKLCVYYSSQTARSFDMICGPSLRSLYLSNIRMPSIGVRPALLRDLPLLQNVVMSNVNVGLRGLELNPNNGHIETAKFMLANMSAEQWNDFVISLLNLQRTFNVELYDTNIDAMSLKFVIASPDFEVVRNDSNKYGKFVNFKRVLNP